MPTYEYVCDACGHAFELFQQMSSPVKRTCPECHVTSLRRLIGPGAGILFKGSGFYETDYRSASYRKGAESEKKRSGKTDEKKSSSKPESPSPGGGSGSSSSPDVP